MLQPVRTKFRKAFKGRIHGKATRAVKLNYGQFGLKATEPERIIGKQIRFGLEFSLISQFRKNLQKLEWEKVRVLQSITLVELNLEE